MKAILCVVSAVLLSGCLFYKAEGQVCGTTLVCDSHATCSSEQRCVCNPGYVGDGTSCTPAGTCSDNSVLCSGNTICSDEGGTPHCVCKQGFSGDGTTCTDIDECASGSATCSPNATCSNTESGFTCACKEGFEGDGFQCTDIDECQRGLAQCDSNANCVNQPGSFDCACKSGYSGNGVVCADIDECATNTAGCDANATCTNLIGSFKCECKTGFSGTGFQCTDINECNASTSPCPASATCQNTSGSFTCICPLGYEYLGSACVDINECARWTDDCAVFATCTNTTGSYTCQCKTGFSGTGQSCTRDTPMPLTVTVPSSLPSFATIRPGWSLDISGQVTCPAAPCSYSWNLGNGQTSTQLNPGLVSYPTAGIYKIVLTVNDSGGALVGQGQANLVVWNGTFTDDFNRASIDWDVYGWVPPILDGSAQWPYHWDIQSGWVHVPPFPNEIHAPGSTGIVAFPLVQDGHVEATIQRNKRTDGYWHYTDILVRMHPVEWNGKFYRIRILQSTELQLAIFRIDHSTDEHGILINDRQHQLNYGYCAIEGAECGQAISGDVVCRDNVCRPVQPRDVPHIDNWNPTHDQDIRVIADVRDVDGVPQFHVKFVNPSNAADVFLEQTISDGLPNPFTYPGLWGVTSFEGDAYFDNFSLTEGKF